MKSSLSTGGSSETLAPLPPPPPPGDSPKGPRTDAGVGDERPPLGHAAVTPGEPGEGGEGAAEVRRIHPGREERERPR